MGELQKKEEEMRQMFVQRVKEKEAELKEAEKEVCLLLTSSYKIYLEHGCSNLKGIVGGVGKAENTKNGKPYQILCSLLNLNTGVQKR